MNFSELKKCMDKFVSVYNVPGVDCIVYKNHKELFRYFTGKSNKENNITMHGNELYLIFSMTKMLTCTAVLQLMEKGKFNLDDKLSEFMPEFENMSVTSDELNINNASKITSGTSSGEMLNSVSSGCAKNPVTIKHLLTMTAGFDYNLDADYIRSSVSEGKVSTGEIAASLSKTVLGFEPGTRFRYSLCYDILGALVEIWSGKNLGEYMEENIFKPLGMKNTFFGVSDERRKEYASRYIFTENGTPKLLPLECNFNFTPDYQSGGAGLTSSTEDYALFLDALACGGTGKSGNRILKAETVKLMGTNHLSGQPLEDFQQLRPGYGYGFGVRTHMNPEISGSESPVGEFGWDGAAGAFSMVDTKNNISLTYFQHVHAWKLSMQNEMRNALYKSFLHSSER